MRKLQEDDAQAQERVIRLSLPRRWDSNRFRLEAGWVSNTLQCASGHYLRREVARDCYVCPTCQQEIGAFEAYEQRVRAAG